MVRQEQSSLNKVTYFEQSKHDSKIASQADLNDFIRPSSFSSNYDAAVIGSGIAGLTSAAYMAKAGLRVMVLERDVHPGGCAASFTHGGYQFAVGATVAMGFEPNGLHRNIYKDLGMTPEFVNVNPAIRVNLPDRKICLYTDRDAWHEELKRAFPIHQENILAFWKDVEAIAKVMNRVSKHFPVMPFKHLDDVLDTLKGFHPNLLTLLPKLNSTVHNLLEKHNLVPSDSNADNERTVFKAFIDGQLLDAMQTNSDKCVLTSGAYALDIYRFGCQYKVGGLNTIAYDLCDYIESRGGTIQFSTRVKSILNKDNHIQGLVTNRGDIQAPIIVSAIPLQNTSELLEVPTSSKLPKLASEQDYGWGAFTMYLGVDSDVIEIPDDSNSQQNTHYFEQYSSPPSDSKHDVNNMLISISPPWDITRAPEGRRAITISTHVDAKEWLALANTSKEVYTDAKRELENTILDKLSTIFPNIRNGIDVMLSGSPRTFKRFTLRADGLVGGFPQDIKHANFQAPSHRTDIKGLYLAGDTIFPGQGTLGTSVSGFNAARSATRFYKRHSKQFSETTSNETTSNKSAPSTAIPTSISSSTN